MNVLSSRLLLVAIVVSALASVSSIAAAEGVSKEACLESHSRGQDAREQGHISLARKLFMTCAQSSCPSLVQNDCARLADQLDRMQPSLSFSARDSKGSDLPDTTVFVDDMLVVTRLDDGKPHDVDPGKHVVRFEHGGRSKTVTVVVGSGEKGRPVVSTFEVPGSSAHEAEGAQAQAKPKRPLGPRIALGLSTALIVGGGVLGVVGLERVPDNCTVSKHQCAAPPGDKSFDDASKAMRLSNVGWALTGVGAVALGASLLWYFKGNKKDARDEKTLTPFATPDSAGLTLTGRM